MFASVTDRDGNERSVGSYVATAAAENLGDVVALGGPIECESADGLLWCDG